MTTHVNIDCVHTYLPCVLRMTQITSQNNGKSLTENCYCLYIVTDVVLKVVLDIENIYNDSYSTFTMLLIAIHLCTHVPAPDLQA